MEIVTITPDMAREWFEARSPNRLFKKAHAENLMRQMIDEGWIWNVSPPICFNGDESVIDGQHRLWAIWKSGLTIKSYVLHDVPSKARRVIDTGKARTFPDLLQIEYPDLKNTRTVAAICHSLFRYGQELPPAMVGTSRLATYNELMSIYERFDQEINRALVAVRPMRSYGVRPNMPAAVCMITKPPTGLPSFSDFVDATVESDDRKDPARHYRHQHLEVQRCGERMPRKRQWDLLVHAWNKFCDGEQIAFLRVPDHTKIKYGRPPEDFCP